MKCVQQALKPVIDLGVPVMEGIWRSDSIDQNPPKQYIVYSATTVECGHHDDKPDYYRTTVYLDFWSKIDTTEVRNAVRDAMYNAGFGMESESSKGYNQPAYDNYTHQYCIQWLWILYSEEMP